ncbi:MAG: Phosphoglycolate phosphatase [Marinobacterium sp. xm-d-530]|nr:MAG: Phosphoglycolate phosphatase [Marinobacterium sp. xm-d-530]
MKYRLLIFDWDGTLIDSQARIVSSFQGATRDLGLRIPSDESVQDIIGLGLPEAILKVMPECNATTRELIRQGYSKHYLEVDQTPTALFDGVFDGLGLLKQYGYRLSVATGKSRRGLDRVLADTELVNHFELTKCADETASKPDPLMLHEILEETGLAAEEVLMIGDTSYDLEMARRAGIDRVAMSYGVHEVSDLQAFEPLQVFDHFNELVDWLRS